MNALVRKEIRLVLPFWIVAMILAVFPVWLLWPGPFGYYLASPGFGVFGPYAISVLLLGLAPFGQELSLGTFSILLAQPAARHHIWMVKTSIIATALVLVFAALCLSIHFRAESVVKTMQMGGWQWFLGGRPTPSEMARIAAMPKNLLEGSLLSGGLWALMAFASGLWTNLAFRNASAAFWSSLIVPLGLFLLMTLLPASSSETMAVAGIVAVMGGYSVAGFLWAKRFFLRVQDNQWTGGVLSFPSLSAVKARSVSRNRKPIRALIRKEFQLHQINLLIAGLLLLAHLVVIVVRRTNAGYFGQHRSEAMIWEAWALLWLVMPVLIGSMAVAEERKLGTLEGFLSLPVARRREFLVKFFVVMVLGIFLGGLMPLFVEWLGSLIGLTHRIFETSMEFNGKFVTFTAEVLGFSAGLAFIAFYASTLTRNLLQALGLALVLSLFSTVFIETAVGIDRGSNYGNWSASLWTGPLIGWIGCPVMIGTILVLAFRNFNQLNVGGKVWWRNALTVLAALFFTTGSTTVIYHRVWELWMPEEPVHQARPVIWNSPSHAALARFVAPKMEASYSQMAVLRQDGTLWLGQRKIEAGTGPWSEGFVAGSNWRDVTVSESRCFAIQSDGSLWDLSEVRLGTTGISDPKTFGGSHAWKKIAGANGHFTGLKTDGTIWEWGYKRVAAINQISIAKLPAPVQVGGDSDWTAICDSRETTAVAKSDGSLWRFGRIHEMDTNGTDRVKRTVEQPEPWLRFTKQHPISLSLNYSGKAIAAVCEDGTLWVGGPHFYESLVIFSRQTAERARSEMVRLETSSDWKEVRFIGWDDMVGVTRSGALWNWKRRRTLYGGDAMSVEMSSLYGSWISACPYVNDTFLALANDGKVCLWSQRHFDEYFNFDYEGKLLAPSRIKARTIAEIHP